MVKPRNRRPRRRRPNQIRTVARTQSRVASFAPLRIRVPNDPPPITMSNAITYRVRTSIIVRQDWTSSGVVDWGSHLRYAIFGLGKSSATALELTPWTINYDQLFWLWGSKLGIIRIDSGDNFDICLNKAVLWGPRNSAHTITLVVDPGAPSTTMTAIDSGTTNRRPCVGLSVPYCIWHNLTSSSNNTPVALIRVGTDLTNAQSAVESSNREEVAILDLTISCRHTTSGVTAPARTVFTDRPAIPSKPVS